MSENVSTAFVGRELARIEGALIAAEPDTARWRELHAAQQALRWTTEPQGYAAPLDVLDGVAGQATSADIPGAPADCLADSRPVPS